MSEKIKSFILSKSNQMENTDRKSLLKKSCGAKSRKSDLKELGTKQLQFEDAAETETSQEGKASQLIIKE